MISNKERDCIEKARQARLDAANARLVDVKKNGVPFDSPADGLTWKWKFKWDEKLGDRIVQIVLLILLPVMFLLLFVMTLIAYIFHLWVTHQKKRELKREINELESEALSGQVPDEKDLESLWWLHGLEDRKYTSDERLNLVSDWVGILYGTDAPKDLRLQSRVDESRERQMKANLPYYEGKDSPHYHFGSPVDSVIRTLSAELPEYE